MTAYSSCAIKSLAHQSFCCFDSVACFHQEQTFNSISSSTFSSVHHSARPFLNLGVHFGPPNLALLFCFQDYSHFTKVAIGNYSILFDVNSKTESYASLEQSCWLSLVHGLAKSYPCFQIICHHY